MTTLRRILILLGLLILVFLVVQNYSSQKNEDLQISETPSVDLSQDELKQRLEETIKKKWDAIVAGDWLTVYEMLSRKARAEKTLVNFMQGRDRSYYDNWKLLELNIDGLNGTAKIQYDWGVHVDIEIDLGTPHNKGAVTVETYFFDAKDMKWYPGPPDTK